MASGARPTDGEIAIRAPEEVMAVRQLAEASDAWPLERYEYEEGVDWLKLSYVWMMVALAFIEVVLAFRLSFLLAAANVDNGFVSFIYDFTGPLVSPFNGIIKASKLGSGAFEPSVLVAMLSYMVGTMLVASIGWAVDTTADEASQRRQMHPRTLRH